MIIDEKVPYGVDYKKATQLLFAGLAAVFFMSLCAYFLRGLGVAAPDFAAQYAAILNNGRYPTPYSSLWLVGLVWHLVNGTLVFSFLFDFLQHTMIIPSRRLVKGLMYGFGLWVLLGMVVAPLAGEGLFFSQLSDPLLVSATALLSWLIYGFVLERMARVRIVHYLEMVDRRAA